MRWKELPSWVKGGAMGIFIWLIYFQALVIRESLGETCLPFGETCAPFLIVYLQKTLGWFLILGFFTLILYSLIGVFLGAVVGWIISKFRGKK